MEEIVFFSPDRNDLPSLTLFPKDDTSQPSIKTKRRGKHHQCQSTQEANTIRLYKKSKYLHGK